MLNVLNPYTGSGHAAKNAWACKDPEEVLLLGTSMGCNAGYLPSKSVFMFPGLNANMLDLVGAST